MRRTIIFVCILLAACIFVKAAQATPGDTIKAVNTPYTCPQGLAFDGKYLWTADRRSDMLYQVDPNDGSVKDSFPTPGYSVCGLTWDGKLLWCVDADESRIYAINPKTRIIEKTIYCPASTPIDLAWDGEYLWIADDGDNKIHQISTEDGTTIISLKAPTSHPGGLAYDGKYLWVSDRFKDMIYMITPDKGDVIISFKSPGPFTCGLAWDGKNLWDVDYQNDLICKLAVDDGTLFSKTEEKMQQLEFVHQVRNYGPDSVKTLDIYMAIPVNMNSQELMEEVTFDPPPDEIIEDKWGQKIAHFKFTDLAASDFTEVVMHAKAKLYENRYFVFPGKVGTLEDIPKEIKDKYLIDDTKFSMDNPIIKEGLKKAIGDETNPYWIARKIFDYIIDHIEYERVGGWNIAPTVLDRGTGSCSEYSFVYIAMCRAAGLPARYVGSVAIRGDDASWDDVFHRWVEIYLPGYGWIPVDPSGGDQEWPADQANYFGHLNNRYLITTAGGGGSEYLEWGYNANERWTSKGRCKIEAENFGEWSPLKKAEE